MISNLEFKTVGHEVAERFFANEASASTWVLKRIHQTGQQYCLDEQEAREWWLGEIEFLKKAIADGYSPKSWECEALL